MIKKWIKAYNTFGDDGLIRKISKQKYTFDFKLFVVKLYLTTEISYQELALKVGMNEHEPSLISRWVNNFKIAGPDAFREKIKGRNPKMPNQKKENYLKQLEDENLKLKIEVAYLKELRRLRLEEETMKQKQELFTSSEDHSN